MAGGKRIETYEDFVKVHGLLLTASGLPRSLHYQLFQKLFSETFDGGVHFGIEPSDDGGRQRRLVLTSDFMAKESHVFLVDHAWTFRLSDAYKQLQEVSGLAERMAALMCVDIDLNSDAEETEEVVDRVSQQNGTKMSVLEAVESEIRSAKGNGDGTVRWLELEDLDIDDDTLSSLNLSSRFPGLLALSLCGNKLENVEIVAQEVTKFEHLRALWLNKNPVVKKCDDQLADRVLQGLPRLEIYNSHFTAKFGGWALGFCGGVYEKDNPGSVHESDHQLESVSSLDLSNRCIHNLINKAFSPVEFPSLSYLNLRGNPLEQNSVADLLQVLKEFPCLRSLEVDIPGPLGESAIEILESLPKLSELNGVNASKILETGKHVIDSILQLRLPEWTAEEPLADRIISAMWLYLMTYRLADEEKIDETSVWYVMDELGSALRHSDEPNFRVAPFLFMPEGDLASAEYAKHCQKQSKSLISPSVHSSATRSLHHTDGSPLCVYTDLPQVEEFLTRSEFVITSEPKDADIVWTSMQVDEDLKKAAGLTDQQYINQFPFEACLVMKHHLAETVQKAHGSPEWLQPTYNLETHLSQLIGDYYVRKRDGLNNLWILKPWNMARTIDTSVTDNLSAIIRLMETGPKICQKYIEHPALFNRKKFDLRYIVLVRSMNPLEIFLSDVYWVRLANNPYTLEKHSFFEYETHFTVMNYRGKFSHKNTPEFVTEFEQEHQGTRACSFEIVLDFQGNVFEGAAVVHPEMHSPRSRAIYGVDVMLDSSFQPKLLEVTYCPDCTRACKYDIVGEGGVIKGRDFFNDVFGCLFLNETTHVSPL
uniref:Tubulin--tyrosine ligase-like protein 12 SET-like domain-containing protein n=1 Tax=Fagus sylvatica TaxID=28930 RepID=A0A2N9H5T5_FAGSY